MKKYYLIFCVLVQTITSMAGDLIADIQYGDSEELVTSKLKKSELIKTQLDNSLFARVGSNGSFETTNTLGGMNFKLFFDWDRAGADKSLNQITFRSSPIPIGAYNSILRPAWLRGQTLLSAMFGKPTNAGEFPELTKLAESGIIYSHAWRTSEGFVYLGIGKQDGQLNLSIGFHKNQLRGY